MWAPEPGDKLPPGQGFHALRVRGDNRHPPARGEYARLDSNQRPPPSQGGALVPMSYERKSCVDSVVKERQRAARRAALVEAMRRHVRAQAQAWTHPRTRAWNSFRSRRLLVMR